MLVCSKAALYLLFVNSIDMYRHWNKDAYFFLASLCSNSSHKLTVPPVSRYGTVHGLSKEKYLSKDMWVSSPVVFLKLKTQTLLKAKTLEQ